MGVRDTDLISMTQVVVDEGATPSDNPAWFPGAKLNWAQNQLRCRSNKVAMIQASK
jgi:acetoacetyl-CoA synthetase